MKSRAEGSSYLKKALSILEALLKEHPNVPAYRHLLALCYREMSRGAQPDSDKSYQSWQAAITLLRQLVKEHPDIPDYQHELIETLAAPRLDFKAAADPSRFEEALELSRDLVSQHPNIPDYRMSRNMIHMTLGWLEIQKGELAKAEKNFRQALEMQKSIMRLDPDPGPHHAFKAGLERSLADVLWKEEKAKEAVAVLQASLKSLEAVLAEHGELGFLRFRLVADYDRLAEMFRELHDEEQSAAARARAKDHRQALPPPPRWK
jgi:tetratricopeptide (TPR) repeat protein